jgi:hypothetical protein
LAGVGLNRQPEGLVGIFGRAFWPGRLPGPRPPPGGGAWPSKIDVAVTLPSLLFVPVTVMNFPTASADALDVPDLLRKVVLEE